MSGSNFLEVVPESKSIFNVLGKPDFSDFEIDFPPCNFKSITPIPGFCVKVKTDDNEKLFINVCHSADIPAPPASLNVFKIIAGEGNKDEEVLFRFPLSIGDPHVELDNTGKEIKCYDVVLNTAYYLEVSNRHALRDFIVTLACSGLERKYNTSIDIGTCSILTKPYHGKMPLHCVKLKPASKSGLSFPDPIKPDHRKDVMPLEPFPRVPEFMSSDPVARYSLFQRPLTGYPVFLIFQCFIQCATDDKKSTEVFVSRLNISVKHPLSENPLYVYLPYPIIPDETTCNFSDFRLIAVMSVEPPPRK